MNSKCCYCTIKWLNEKISGSNQTKQGSGVEGETEVTQIEGMAEEEKAAAKKMPSRCPIRLSKWLWWDFNWSSCRLEVGSPHRSVSWLLVREKLAGNRGAWQLSKGLSPLLWVSPPPGFLNQQPDLLGYSSPSPVPTLPLTRFCLFFFEGRLASMTL